MWVKHNPECVAVRGFLFFDLARVMPFVWFNAHSVVRLPDGKLVDITPSKASTQYPFIEHRGSAELFEAAGKFPRLEHYL
jgi:hypothetical protein